MYDLTVDDAHTFAVGAGAWVVHNDCDITNVKVGSSDWNRAQSIRDRYNLSRSDATSPAERNVGFADAIYSIDGEMQQSSVEAISVWYSPNSANPYTGTVDLLPADKRRFEYLTNAETSQNPNVPNPNGSRAVDSEAKILEHYANLFDPNNTGGNTQVTGTIILYTERIPCRSCGGEDHISGVIGQFQDQFPGVDVQIRFTYEDD